MRLPITLMTMIWADKAEIYEFFMFKIDILIYCLLLNLDTNYFLFNGSSFGASQLDCNSYNFT
jgi:hypothetical protein